MDLRHLITFRSVANLMSFSRAAASLDYAQSTVTLHIQSLEDEMGVRLFNRIGKKIELTEAGNRLLRYSERLIDLAEETVAGVSGQDDVTGTLTVGAAETVCTYRLPQVLRQFRQQMPQVRLIFRPMPYEALFPSVVEGKVDIAFVLEQSIHSDQLYIERLTCEPLLIVAATDHQLVNCSEISLRDLAGEPLLLTEKGCCYRALFERALLAEGVPPTSNMEFSSVEAIKQCVMANVGVALLPQVAVAKELKAQQLVVLPYHAASFEVYTQMLWHKDKWVSPAMQTFLDISRLVLREIEAQAFAK